MASKNVFDVTHLVYRFSVTDVDAVPQIRRMLSGAGTQNCHPNGPGNWCLKWHGVSTKLTPQKSWIALCHDGMLHGWVRFCHFKDMAADFGDPASTRHGAVLFVDRSHRLSSALRYNGPPRSHYVNDAKARKLKLGCPKSNGGELIVWVTSTQPHKQKLGCYDCQSV